MNTKRFSLISLLAAALIGLTAAGVRILLTISSYDSVYGVYDHGAVPPVVCGWLLAAACALLFALGHLGAKSLPPHPMNRMCDGTIFAACMAGFLSFSDFILTIINSVRGFHASMLGLCRAVAAVFAFIYFLLLLKAKLKQPVSLSFFSFMPLIWCVFYLIEIYFDKSTLVVSPNKTMNMLALLAAMVGFLMEARLHLGFAETRLYSGVMCFAPVLLLTSSLPNMIISERLSIGSADNFICYAVEAAFALFFLSRLWGVPGTDADACPPALPETDRADEASADGSDETAADGSGEAPAAPEGGEDDRPASSDEEKA